MTLLKTSKNLYTIDPETGHLTLDFHYYQGRSWASTSRFVFLLAGTQGGKTSFGPWWLWREVYGDGHLFRGRGSGDYIAATSTYDLFKLKMLPEARTVFEDVLGVGRYWGGDRVIELQDPDTGLFWAKRASDRMWGRIILRSAHVPNALESMTAKGAWLDECGQDEFPYDAWEAVQRRTAINHGRVLGTTTPYNLGWVKHEILDRYAAGDPDYCVVQFPSWINPSFPKDEFERAKRTLPKWRFDMFYRGLFTRPAGMIYECFDEEKMTYEPFEIPKNTGEVIVGIDFGGANNAKLWLWKNSTTEIWHVFMEELEGGISTREHCQNTLKFAEGFYNIEYYGGSGSEGQIRRDWAVEGVLVHQPYTDDVEVGISAVIEMFKDGKLLISKDCKGVINELGSYSRVLDPENSLPTNQISAKASYHRLDALRYACVTIMQGGFWSQAPGE